jgi:ABC-type multidrug transport system fused ATPase/permease subunit
MAAAACVIDRAEPGLFPGNRSCFLTASLVKYLFRLRTFPEYRGQFVLNQAFLMSTTWLSLVVSQIIQQVIDEGMKSGASAFLVRSALLLGIGVLTAGLNLGERYLTGWISAHVGYDLPNSMHDRIVAFHDSRILEQGIHAELLSN